MLVIGLILGYIVCGFVALVIAYKTDSAEDSAGIIVALWPLCLWFLFVDWLDHMARVIARK